MRFKVAVIAMIIWQSLCTRCAEGGGNNPPTKAKEEKKGDLDEFDTDEFISNPAQYAKDHNWTVNLNAYDDMDLPESEKYDLTNPDDIRRSLGMIGGYYSNVFINKSRAEKLFGVKPAIIPMPNYSSQYWGLNRLEPEYDPLDRPCIYNPPYTGGTVLSPIPEETEEELAREMADDPAYYTALRQEYANQNKHANSMNNPFVDNTSMNNPFVDNTSMNNPFVDNTSMNNPFLTEGFVGFIDDELFYGPQNTQNIGTEQQGISMSASRSMSEITAQNSASRETHTYSSDLRTYNGSYNGPQEPQAQPSTSNYVWPHSSTSANASSQSAADFAYSYARDSSHIPNYNPPESFASNLPHTITSEESSSSSQSTVRSVGGARDWVARPVTHNYDSEGASGGIYNNFVSRPTYIPGTAPEDNQMPQGWVPHRTASTHGNNAHTDTHTQDPRKSPIFTTVKNNGEIEEWLGSWALPSTASTSNISMKAMDGAAHSTMHDRIHNTMDGTIHDTMHSTMHDPTSTLIPTKVGQNEILLRTQRSTSTHGSVHGSTNTSTNTSAHGSTNTTTHQNVVHSPVLIPEEEDNIPDDWLDPRVTTTYGSTNTSAHGSTNTSTHTPTFITTKTIELGGYSSPEPAMEPNTHSTDNSVYVSTHTPTFITTKTIELGGYSSPEPAMEPNTHSTDNSVYVSTHTPTFITTKTIELGGYSSPEPAMEPNTHSTDNSVYGSNRGSVHGSTHSLGPTMMEENEMVHDGALEQTTTIHSAANSVHGSAHDLAHSPVPTAEDQVEILQRTKRATGIHSVANSDHSRVPTGEDLEIAYYYCSLGRVPDTHSAGISNRDLAHSPIATEVEQDVLLPRTPSIHSVASSGHNSPARFSPINIAPITQNNPAIIAPQFARHSPAAELQELAVRAITPHSEPDTRVSGAERSASVETLFSYYSADDNSEERTRLGVQNALDALDDLDGYSEPFPEVQSEPTALPSYIASVNNYRSLMGAPKKGCRFAGQKEGYREDRNQIGTNNMATESAVPKLTETAGVLGVEEPRLVPVITANNGEEQALALYHGPPSAEMAEEPLGTVSSISQAPRINSVGTQTANTPGPALAMDVPTDGYMLIDFNKGEVHCPGDHQDYIHWDIPIDYYQYPSTSGTNQCDGLLPTAKTFSAPTKSNQNTNTSYLPPIAPNPEPAQKPSEPAPYVPAYGPWTYQVPRTREYAPPRVPVYIPGSYQAGQAPEYITQRIPAYRPGHCQAGMPGYVLQTVPEYDPYSNPYPVSTQPPTYDPGYEILGFETPEDQQYSNYGNYGSYGNYERYGDYGDYGNHEKYGDYGSYEKYENHENHEDSKEDYSMPIMEAFTAGDDFFVPSANPQAEREEAVKEVVLLLGESLNNPDPSVFDKMIEDAISFEEQEERKGLVLRGGNAPGAFSLSFEESPSGITRELLAVLKPFKRVCAFYVDPHRLTTGDSLDVVKEIMNNSHVVGLSVSSKKSLKLLTKEGSRRLIKKAYDLFVAKVGWIPQSVRLPYQGYSNDDIKYCIEELNLVVTEANYDTLDYLDLRFVKTLAKFLADPSTQEIALVLVQRDKYMHSVRGVKNLIGVLMGRGFIFANFNEMTGVETLNKKGASALIKKALRATSKAFPKSMAMGEEVVMPKVTANAKTYPEQKKRSSTAATAAKIAALGGVVVGGTALATFVLI
ncbi:hypothetical protein NEDG_00356 [Nematocida displodere]|uniref:Uncharacterized protein n=1 Tax=Nematocida displodere TaxID=1805483 RepID=A0A177EK98_9MICR|nr:hypothetical protein NEDG_00356 [Nematocida displodere]